VVPCHWTFYRACGHEAFEVCHSLSVKTDPCHDGSPVERIGGPGAFSLPRMVPRFCPTRIGGAIASSFKSELEPQHDLRPENLPDDGGLSRSNRLWSIEYSR